MSSFVLKPQYCAAIRWSRRGSCGNRGCADPECCCSFCGLPIGVADDDPRWDEHEEDCADCELCRDQVPAMLFRGKGKRTEGAQFHWKCFEKIVYFREGITETAAALQPVVKHAGEGGES